MSKKSTYQDFEKKLLRVITNLVKNSKESDFELKIFKYEVNTSEKPKELFDLVSAYTNKTKIF